MDTGSVTLCALTNQPTFSLFILDVDDPRLSVMVYSLEVVRGYVDNDCRAAVNSGEWLLEHSWKLPPLPTVTKKPAGSDSERW